ncbi:hypothetical protein HPB50_021496 [Hyalomma asiaticum]|uniref:Uncharacterized protein n=1 Tax=Hyalomma asiaticum TaxID=266040 RepID=A0ACB7SNG8_HYAAI|nr:hypothetical protein HPB50_021496 [Hyalomma asiaticum]
MDYTMAVFPATIVDYALDKGSSRNDADLSVTYCSPAELVGRVVLPLIGDCKVVSRTTLVSGSFFLLAVTMLALPATPSFLTYIIVCACGTMLLACLLAMKPVVTFETQEVATMDFINFKLGCTALLPVCSGFSPFSTEEGSGKSG